VLTEYEGTLTMAATMLFAIPNLCCPFVILDNLPPSFYSYLRNDSDLLKFFEPEDAAVRFGDLFKRINEAIKSLNGRVFVKLGEKAPLDAEWIGIGKSLVCTDANDILTLLKASIVVHQYILAHEQPMHQENSDALFALESYLP
jgi:D123